MSESTTHPMNPAGQRSSIQPPRVLVIDLTAKGDGTATGQVKSTIFGAWPPDRYMQFYSRGRGEIGIQSVNAADEAFLYPDDLVHLLNAATDFQPDLILYRPVPDAAHLHAVAMHLLEAQPDLPLVTWIMDDWPARLESDDPAQARILNDDLRRLLDRSVLRLSIGDRMSEVFRERYGHEFLPFANGIDPGSWLELERAPRKEFVLRYAGGLAENMTSDSVLRIAQAVEALAEEGNPIKFEVRTRPIWESRQREHYQGLKHTEIFTNLLPEDAYTEWLRSADGVLIAYNYDVDSLRYIGLSMANKLPECLASGAVVVAHGPHEAATIAYLKAHDCAEIIEDDNIESVRNGLLNVLDGAYRERLIARAREVAFKQHDIRDIRERLGAALSGAAATSRGNSAHRKIGFDSTLLILGNGPSLKGVDFERFRNFDCLGMNAAYRYWHEINWYPRYYACLDHVVGLSHKDAIADLIRRSDDLGIDLFFLRPNLIDVLPEDIRHLPKVLSFDAFCEERLGEARKKGVTTGSHSALIAALLGYGRLALLGIDCNYVEEVSGSRRAADNTLEMAATPKENPNYFFDGYQVAGDKYNIPNPRPDLHIQSWRDIAPFLSARGIDVWNCSPISKVDAFLFRSLDDMEADQRERCERPRTLNVRRLLATPTIRRANAIVDSGRGATQGQPRGVGFARWTLKFLWQRRLGMGGVAIAAIVLPLILAAFVSGNVAIFLVVFSALCAATVVLALVLIRLIQLMETIAQGHAHLALCDAREAVGRGVRQAVQQANAYTQKQLSIVDSRADLDRRTWTGPLEDAVVDVAAALSTIAGSRANGPSLEVVQQRDRSARGHDLLLAVVADLARTDAPSLSGKTLTVIGGSLATIVTVGTVASTLGLKFKAVGNSDFSNCVELFRRVLPDAELVRQDPDQWLAPAAFQLDFVMLGTGLSSSGVAAAAVAPGGYIAFDEPDLASALDPKEFMQVAATSGGLLLQRANR